MSNQYIEAICTMPQEVAFGYDPYANLSWTQRRAVDLGTVRPESTVEYRWHYAKAAANRMNKLALSGKPSNGLIMSVLNKAKGASTQFSLPPTSNKSVWFQGAIALQALAIFYQKKYLRGIAQDFYYRGNSAKFSSSMSTIQSTAKNMYRKAAKAMEKAGLVSSESQVRFMTKTIRDYAKLSEISFGKKLSIESSSTTGDLIRTDTQKALRDAKEKATINKEVKKIKKARGLSVKASVTVPFKNKKEGNVFRAWVNDNHRRWAKKNDLSRSGAFNNSYIKKAWKRWGQDYEEAMAQKAFMERANDDLVVAKPAAVAAPVPVVIEPKPLAASAPMPFDDASDPFADEDPEVGMMELLQDDPEEFLKKYWYIPTGGFVGVIVLALGIRALVK